MILVENHDFPYVAMQLSFEGGTLSDPVGKEGLLYLTTQMLLRGTSRMSQAEFNEELETLGGALAASAGRERSAIEGEVLARNIEPFLVLLGDALSRPAFAQDELDKLRRQTLAELAETRDNDEALVRDVFRQVLLQPDVSARPIQGTAESLARITRSDLVNCYQRVFTRARLLIGAVGDTDRQSLDALLDRVLELPEGVPAPPHEYVSEDPGQIRVILLDKPERTQTQIFFGHQAIPVSHADYYPLWVANTIYGGTFTARLSHEIREKRGWSYGAYSYLQSWRTHGTFSVRFYPASADAVPALTLGLQMQRDLVRDGVSEEEVRFAKSYLINQVPFRTETPGKRLRDAVSLALLGLDPDTTARLVERLEQVSVEQVNAAIRAHLKAEDLVVVVVCTAAEIQDGVQGIEGIGDVMVHPFDKDWTH
jgi:zinc protease